MEWENISLPLQPGDKAQIWQVLRLEKFNVRAKTSASVIVNFRARKLRMGFRQRVKCLLSWRVASNRLMCSHELASVRFLEDTNFYACEHECIDDASTEEVETDIREFLPTKSQRFLACSGEENRIRKVIESIQSGKKCDNYSFTGVDVWSECTACHASWELDNLKSERWCWKELQRRIRCTMALLELKLLMFGILVVRNCSDIMGNGTLFSLIQLKIFLQLSCLIDGLTRSVQKALHSVIPSTLVLKGVTALLWEITNSGASHYWSPDKLTTHCPRF